jgi:hypothetical protein
MLAVSNTRSEPHTANVIVAVTTLSEVCPNTLVVISTNLRNHSIVQSVLLYRLFASLCKSGKRSVLILSNMNMEK